MKNTYRIKTKRFVSVKEIRAAKSGLNEIVLLIDPEELAKPGGRVAMYVELERDDSPPWFNAIIETYLWFQEQIYELHPGMLNQWDPEQAFMLDRRDRFEIDPQIEYLIECAGKLLVLGENHEKLTNRPVARRVTANRVNIDPNKARTSRKNKLKARKS